MKKSQIKISVITVNYNVKDFLEQSLISMKRALKGISSEIIVVDNASIDGSVQMLRKRFSDVQLIENNTNLGFSAANNQAIKKAKGEYIVIINPDTVVQEDTFTKLFEFFKQNPQASAVTCKILNPDGTFSIDCRHSIPTPSTAFWKLIGFSRLFPKSRIFGKYNLTYLDENKTYQVEAISGSFMMIKREIFQDVGLLDERFFMYCEDIDYCHRINQAGGKIYYVPTSQIIHYKGESTKKNNLDYIVTFNKSLYQFYKKHYQQKYVYPFKWLILLGVVLRGILIFFRNVVQTYYPFILDFFILNVVLFLSFYVRFELTREFRLQDFFREHIVVNIITSVTFFIASLFFDSLNRDRFSILKTIKVNFVTYTSVAASTFFLRQFAFSRLIILFSAIFTTTLMMIWRIALRFYNRKHAGSSRRKFFLKRSLIVGYDKETQNLLTKLQERVDSGLDIIGVVSLDRKYVGQSLSGLPVVASIDQLPEYLRLRTINLVIFTTHDISYETILSTMANVQNQNIEFKMVPDHFEFMVSKSNIERLDSVPLVDIKYAYGRPFNRFIKRATDISFSFTLLLLFLPVNLILIPVHLKQITRKVIREGSRFQKDIYWFKKPGFIRFNLNLFEVFRGNLSFVGASIETKSAKQFHFDYKPGITGILQITQNQKLNKRNIEKLELQYLKNQDFLLDLEILFKSILNKLAKR